MLTDRFTLHLNLESLQCVKRYLAVLPAGYGSTDRWGHGYTIFALGRICVGHVKSDPYIVRTHLRGVLRRKIDVPIGLRR